MYYLNQTKFFKGSAEIALAGEISKNEISEEAATIYNFSPIDGDWKTDWDSYSTNFVIVDSAYLLNDNNPLSNILPTREGLLIYKVQKGDTISKIAANFGISLNTILWANKNLKKTSSLRVGQELVILPVSGILHEIQPGETLDSIANLYSADSRKIIALNRGLFPDQLGMGSAIIIPGAKPAAGYSYASIYNLPDLAGYFAIPTTGWNWGRLHNFNAVDIANACGTPIYASAEGLVTEAVADGWNGGYGSYIVIEHPNGTYSKYAHTMKNTVSAGDYILKGDVIGYIGNSGNTHGPTGCHLHFEIKGAKNPFAK